MLWITREGRQLRVVDMSTEHIANAVAMLARKNLTIPSDLTEELASRTRPAQCVHGWTGYDFCPTCSSETLDDLVPSGGPSTSW